MRIFIGMIGVFLGAASHVLAASVTVATTTPEQLDALIALAGKTWVKTHVILRSDDPDLDPDLKSIPSLGPYLQISLDAVARAQPQLIFVSTHEHSPRLRRSLRHFKNLTVVDLPPVTLSSYPDWVRRMGQSVGVSPADLQAHADRWSQQRERISKLPKRTEKWLIYAQKSPPFVAGPGSCLTDALALRGITPLFGPPNPPFFKTAQPQINLAVSEAERKGVAVRVFELAVESTSATLQAPQKSTQSQVLDPKIWARCSPALLRQVEGL